LFDAQLAVEKALKAAIMEKTGEPHPKIHSLFALATILKEDWPAQEKELFDALSDFAVAARYDDPAWALTQATRPQTERWIRRTEAFLSSFLP
jgi:HEPN domain-containing protein